MTGGGGTTSSYCVCRERGRGGRERGLARQQQRRQCAVVIPCRGRGRDASIYPFSSPNCTDTAPFPLLLGLHLLVLHLLCPLVSDRRQLLLAPSGFLLGSYELQPVFGRKISKVGRTGREGKKRKKKEKEEKKKITKE